MLKLPSSLTTVTLFSKLIAGVLFFTFIILGFFAGMKYQEKIDLIKYQQANLIKTKPSPTPDPTANWKTENDLTFGYSFRYPSDFKSILGLGDHIFYSPDAQFDKTTRAKTKGIEIGSVVYGPGEELKKDTQDYIGPNTIIDATLSSKLILFSNEIAKAYVNTEDITITIDYKKNNEDMRLLIWCGGENGSSVECKDLLTILLPTFKFTDQVSSPGRGFAITGSGCKIGGCNGEICQEKSSEPIASICVIQTGSPCYRMATCEKQNNGKCGWTQTTEVINCLKNTNK